MKTSKIITVLIIFLLPIKGEDCVLQPNYTGTYKLTTGEVTLTLTMKQDEFNVLTGTLESSSGLQYTLEGMVSEGIAAGAVSGSEGALYFEAYLEGNDLTISLIEPDPYNMPDYDTAKYLVMSRSNQQLTPSPSASQPQPQVPVQSAPQQQVTATQPDKPPINVKPGTERVNDEVNGYSFSKPDGWVHQQADGQILLGSHTIPGVISVFPHQAKSMQELHGLMQLGIQEEGVFLTLDGNVQQKGSNRVVGYYNGSVQGEQARGYGMGLLSPHGGGIYILAVSTPQKLGQEIMAAADYLASNTQFNKRKTGDSNLVRHFSGEWAWTNGYRTSWMTFFPDGSYSDQSEASYSGNLSDGSGNVTGNWGVAGQDSNRGRWSIQGTMDSGVITVVNPDGSRNRYEYSVFVERGEKYYREYMINGYHYSKQKDF